MATELSQALPLKTSAADLRDFGRVFPGHELLSQARREAGAYLPLPPPGDHLAATTF